MKMMRVKTVVLMVIVACIGLSCGENDNQEKRKQAFIEKARKQLYERVEQYHEFAKQENSAQMAKMILPKKNLRVGTEKVDDSVDFFLSISRSPLVNTLLSYKIEGITFKPDSTEAIVRMQLITRNREGRRMAGSERQKWVFVYDSWFYDFTAGVDDWK